MRIHKDSKKQYELTKQTFIFIMGTSIVSLLFIETWIWMIIAGALHSLIGDIPAVSFLTMFKIVFVLSYFKLFAKFIKSEAEKNIGNNNAV